MPFEFNKNKLRGKVFLFVDPSRFNYSYDCNVFFCKMFGGRRNYIHFYFFSCSRVGVGSLGITDS